MYLSVLGLSTNLLHGALSQATDLDGCNCHMYPAAPFRNCAGLPTASTAAYAQAWNNTCANAVHGMTCHVPCTAVGLGGGWNAACNDGTWTLTGGCIRESSTAGLRHRWIPQLGKQSINQHGMQQYCFQIKSISCSSGEMRLYLIVQLVQLIVLQLSSCPCGSKLCLSSH